jgi:hypothetical protein
MKDRIVDPILPVALTAALAGGAWIVSNSFRSEMESLTSADEIRIVAGMRQHSDDHYRVLREDLASIRTELARIATLQMEIVLRLSEEN